MELLAEAPEMANARVTLNIQGGHPFRYLRNAGIKHGTRVLYVSKVAAEGQANPLSE